MDVKNQNIQYPYALTKIMSQAAPGGLGRYIKKKSMDPLETYVPAVLQARAQLLQAGAVMGARPSRSCSKVLSLEC